MGRRDFEVLYTFLTPAKAAELAPGLLTVEQVRAAIRAKQLKAVTRKGRYYTTPEWVGEYIEGLAA